MDSKQSGLMVLALIIAFAFVVSGCAGNLSSNSGQNSTNASGSSPAAQNSTISTNPGTGSSLNGSGAGSASGKEIVALETTDGNIEIELDRAKAPMTVDNFVSYVKSGFYDGTIFHRVISGFMIQGGGFNEAGDEKLTRPPIKLESSNGLHNGVGTVAMARTSSPDSATSQFFINTADNGFLDKNPSSDGYAVFGKVVSGMDAVSKIESVDTGKHGANGDWPTVNIVIKRAYMK